VVVNFNDPGVAVAPLPFHESHAFVGHQVNHRIGLLLNDMRFGVNAAWLPCYCGDKCYRGSS
jgi:hypothetical protein